MITKTHKVVAMLGICLCGSALAGGPRGGYQDYGRVIYTEPIYETIRVNRPERECWDERVQYSAPVVDPVAPIIGGIIGGVVGHQFGGGRGKDALTVAGTLIGAGVGAQAGAHPGPGWEQTERRCETVDRVDEERRLVGYRVEYEYQGRTFTTQTRERPGDYIPVSVAVRPRERW